METAFAAHVDQLEMKSHSRTRAEVGSLLVKELEGKPQRVGKYMLKY